MAEDRRALLRRQLLKQQLSKESPPEAIPSSNSPMDLIGAIPGVGQALQGGAEGFVESAPALGRGALQGATLGTSDELTGAAKATGGLVGQALQGQIPDILPNQSTGAPGLAAKYREYQQQSQLANKQSEKEHPIAYTAGELAGGLASAALAPESIGGATLGGSKITEALGSVSPKVADFLVGKAGGLGSKVLGKGVSSAIEGLPSGAVAGAGTSENTLESNPTGLAKDIGSGMELGSLGGLALGGAMAGGKQLASETLPNFAQKYDFTRKLGEAYDLGQKGLSPDTTRGKDISARMSQHIPDKIVNQIMEVDSNLGQQVGEAIDTAQASGITINIDPAFEKSVQDVSNQFIENPALLSVLNPKSKAAISKVVTDGMGDLTPHEAWGLRKAFGDISDNLIGVQGSELAQKQVYNISDALDQQLKNSIPEYKDAATKFSNFRESIPETILEPGVPVDKRTKYLGSLKNKQAELFQKTKELFGGAQLPGHASIEGPRSGMEQLKRNLPSLQRTNPEAVEGLGGDADKVFTDWRQKADQLAMLRQSQGVQPHGGFKHTLAGQVVGSGEGFIYNLANRAGGAVAAAGQSAPVKMASGLFNSDNGTLMNLATKMKSNNATKMIGDALESSLQKKDQIAKNAVLFRMMQDPYYRKILLDEGLDTGENGQ